MTGNVDDAARTIEALSGVPPIAPAKEMTMRERQEQAARVRRFLALPPELQEGILRYGENIRKAYKS